MVTVVIGPLAYEHCASCGHLGATHTSTGTCLASVGYGIAGGRRLGQCRCAAFVPPKGAFDDARYPRDPLTSGPLRTDNLGLPTREVPGMGPPK